MDNVLDPATPVAVRDKPETAVYMFTNPTIPLPDPTAVPLIVIVVVVLAIVVALFICVIYGTTCGAAAAIWLALSITQR
jgi:hypothetical protein